MSKDIYILNEPPVFIDTDSCSSTYITSSPSRDNVNIEEEECPVEIQKTLPKQIVTGDDILLAMSIAEGIEGLEKLPKVISAYVLKNIIANISGVADEHLSLGETDSTAYRGDRGKIAYDHSQSPHAPVNAWVFNENTIKNILINSAIEAEVIRFNRLAGEIIPALKVVWEDVDNKVYLLDYKDNLHIDLIAGISVTSAGTLNEITIQREGWLDIEGLGLDVGNVWLGINGSLTQIPPDTGFDVLVGYVVSDDRLYLNFQDNIFLGD